MISDDFVIYLLGLMILLIINIIGYTKIPILMVIGVIGTIILAPLAILGFGDHYMIAVILVLANAVIPALGLTSTYKGG